ncbi:uncharacterized protein HKW66_Vig0042810 [Vigna angularis]|uniref:Uncharacterized protein n=1 Tax=Phaseolus angularis TaxID=3914 RepID=A0A8T0KZ59_PHAAN|nr:uncharacterized protein HKW66_Vig0042810 [Vigna angularis]
MPNTRTLFLLRWILAPNNQRRRQSRGTHELHHGLLRSQPLLSPALYVLTADARRLAALTAALIFSPPLYVLHGCNLFEFLLAIASVYMNVFFFIAMNA